MTAPSLLFNKTTHLLGFGFVWMFMLALGSCSSSDKPGYLVATPKDSSIQTYLTDTVRRERASAELLLNGKIGYDQDSVTPVFPFVSGVVDAIEVGLGDYVHRGQVLAYVHSGDVAERESDYREAKTDHDLALRTYDNAKAQFDAGFAAEAEVTRAKSALERAKQELQRKLELLKLYGASSDKESKGMYVVKAPLDGFIVERNINRGTQIRPDNATPLFTISNLKRVWAFANIYEQDVRKVHIGLKAEVDVISFPGKTYKGKVEKIATALDEQSRVLQARVSLDNRGGELRPEMFATLHMQLDSDTSRRLSLPSKAIIFSNNRYYVVAGSRPGKFRIERVEIIRNSANRSFVAAGHLAVGDTVLTDGNLTVFADLKRD